MRGGICFRMTATWAAALMIIIGAPLAHRDAFAGLGAHYLGHSAQGKEFRVYLDGGEFLGKHGGFHLIRVTVHLVDGRQRLHRVEGCIYRFDEMKRERDRLECGSAVQGPLAGAQYVRPIRAKGQTTTALANLLVCIRQCGPAIPGRLAMEGSDEDNG